MKSTPHEKVAEPFKIRFRVTVLDHLERIAQHRGSTVNEVVRRLVDTGLEHERAAARMTAYAERSGRVYVEKLLDERDVSSAVDVRHHEIEEHERALGGYSGAVASNDVAWSTSRRRERKDDV
jgi:hypothetical protein